MKHSMQAGKHEKVKLFCITCKIYENIIKLKLFKKSIDQQKYLLRVLYRINRFFIYTYKTVLSICFVYNYKQNIYRLNYD